MVKGIEKTYYQLATLLDAGMPIIRSLHTIAETSTGRLKKAFAFIEDRVSAGSQLNQAMAQKHRVFEPLDITVVAAAEESGNLPATLKMLSEWYDLKLRLRRRLIGGMSFPVLVLHLAVFLGPLPFVFLGRMSGYEYLYSRLMLLAWLWGIAVALWLIVKYLPKRGIVRFAFNELLQFIPLLGKALRRLAFGRFCRSFYMLYSSGIPIVTAAELAVGLTGNAVISKRLEGGAKSARSGNPMYKGFKGRLLPVEFRSMWEIGEESGELDETALRLARMYEQRAQFDFEQFIFWLPKFIYGLVMLYMIYLIARNLSFIYGAAGAF